MLCESLAELIHPGVCEETEKSAGSWPGETQMVCHLQDMAAFRQCPKTLQIVSHSSFA